MMKVRVDDLGIARLTLNGKMVTRVFKVATPLLLSFLASLFVCLSGIPVRFLGGLLNKQATAALLSQGCGQSFVACPGNQKKERLLRLPRELSFRIKRPISKTTGKPNSSEHVVTQLSFATFAHLS